MVGTVNNMAKKFNLLEFFSKQDKLSIINEDTYELNIQPAASILNVFSRLSYKAWYAIAEFVDNSTQSYLSHEKEMKEIPGFEKLVIQVRYDAAANTLTITDNAYGMEINRFRDAILLDAKNDEQTGRNEFGMGLKTAASWFGNIWTVISTQYGSSNKFSATVNIPALKEDGLNSIKISRETVDPNSHGTTIIIEEITKKITAPRTKHKIVDLLSSMYRRDINDKNIEIWFGDEMISFEEYPVLQNFRGKQWKKPLAFDVHFDGRVYKVTGFVAIMNPGSFPNAGFALFRQNRVIIGGSDANYKPSRIFGQAQSQISLKLFGELNMDDFPVNQAKDGFVWDDGLEDAFIEALKANIQEYIRIAELSKKQREEEEQYSPEKSSKLQNEVAPAVSDMAIDIPQKHENATIDTTTASESENDIEVQEYIETVLNTPVEEMLVSTSRSYRIALNAVTEITVSVQWATGSKDYWIEYHDEEDGSISVLINIDHPFFMPYSKDEEFKTVLEKFVLAFVIAEKQAKLTSDKDGYIFASTIKNNMNRYLSKMSEE